MTAQREPRVGDEPDHRKWARQIRDRQWSVLERIAEHDPLYICWWNKNGRHKKDNRPDDLLVCGLIDGSELAQWLRDHPDWTIVGEWSDERYAAPVWITDAGREALANRHLYDMEPVYWGLVEPGWQTIPAEKTDPED